MNANQPTRRYDRNHGDTIIASGIYGPRSDLADGKIDLIFHEAAIDNIVRAFVSLKQCTKTRILSRGTLPEEKRICGVAVAGGVKGW
jgi:hypothetical protein